MVDAGQSLLGGLALRRQRRVDNFNKEQVFVNRNQALAEALIKSASDIQTNAAAVGKSVDLSPFRERLEGLVQSAGAVRAREFGADPDQVRQSIDNILTQFDAAVAAAATAPTPSETAVAEGQASVAGAQATAQALTEGGTPTTTGNVAEAAGLTTAPEKASVANFRMPDGSIEAADLNDTAKISSIINQGGVKISLSVQATELSGIGAVTEVTKKEREDVKQSIQDTNAQIEELGETLKQFSETPEAGGLLGPIIEKAGGVIQQLPGGERVLEGLDVDPAEVKAVRSNARAVASQMLSVITAEEGGRFTDKEREIATEVLGALDLTSSTEQISAALNQAVDLMKRSEGRQMVRFLQASGADISTPDGETAFVQALIDNGFSQDRAIDSMLDLKERLSID